MLTDSVLYVVGSRLFEIPAQKLLVDHLQVVIRWKGDGYLDNNYTFLLK